MNTLSRIIKRRSSSCGFGSSMIPVEDDDDDALVDDIGWVGMGVVAILIIFY